MNVLHMKYAVEVARAGSINKAAEELYMAQPNLSRCIKELEADLGIAIFERSPKGMTLTPEGEGFIRYARKALDQIDEIERLYKNGPHTGSTFSIYVPRASYISDAFARFSCGIPESTSEIIFKETTTTDVINSIINSDCRIGIIRYLSNYDGYFREMLDEKGLEHEVIAEFSFVIVMNAECPAAKNEKMTLEDLRSLTEIAHGDTYIPSLPTADIREDGYSGVIRRRMFLFERASKFELLAKNPGTFMWVSPLPRDLLDRYGLVQRECVDIKKIYKDVLVRKKDYELSELDERFIAELRDYKRKNL